jgi:hypothetical protein
LKTQFIEQEFAYNGSQLRSLFAYMGFEVQGDSIVSWIGPCDIPNEHMVDGEDLLAGATIAGGRMVHFIIEKFHTPLIAAVALQRLFASICLDFLQEHDRAAAHKLRRSGDDLYFNGDKGEGKLSISIATVSPVSSLIHFAVNCTNDGTPVKTAALSELGLEPKKFAAEVMKRFATEMQGIEEATVKVRWVK